MPTKSETASPKAAASNGKKILLVDDDLTLAEMYSERLKSEGYQVAMAHDGTAGLAAVKAKKPDLVLLDVMMPKTNGLDVLKQIKADPEIADIKVILLTALIQEPGQINEISKQAAGYVVKSETTPGELVAKIKALL
jgi:DNA-binding response OmpR family regulator